jgi:cellulose synthase/poly-beta-1,6-N-acetylglucosamine synthase-like glycosyltransferase/tetratricopeptide (TPR) repeat protein
MNQAPSPLFRKFMIVLASVICVFYLAYRALWTFNLSTPYAVFASVFLYVGELFGIMNLLLYFLQVWEVSEPPPQPVLEGRTVDVLVPTYNEDVSLLRATLEACVRMDYPHKTYVLDDGSASDGRRGRPEVEALANELGVIYITRPNNLHAKAGNLNNALEQTDGEFVIVLDADHVPEPHFITRLIGYFSDEGLAFVQTPHAFYNFDSFQARLDHGNRKYWEEGDLFYRVIQPGRNHWNAPIFAGSAAMFRRSSLREVGYIATETVTEDMHTGLRLHAKGWKSIAIGERLVAGQAPPDIATFHKQRQRWAEGNLGIMKYDNPLFMGGLTTAQRLCYFGSMIHWASGLFKLAIYLTPIMMLFSGVPPVREFTWNLAIVTLTYLFTSLYAMKAVSNGYGSIINSELFAMVNFWTQIKGTIRAILFRRTEFGVTGKKTRTTERKSVWPYVRPQTYLIILSVLALFWGWMKLKLELNPVRFLSTHWAWFNQYVEGTAWNASIPAGFGISDDYFKPVVPTIWVLIFFWLAYKVTQRAFWPADRRITTRHIVHLPVEYEISLDQGTIIHYGVTVDLNDTGMALIAYDEVPKGAVMRFTIRGGGEVVKCKGEVRSVEKLLRGGVADGYRYGIQFQNLTSPQVDAINRICLHYAVPRMFDEYARGNRNTVWTRIKGWQGRSFAQRRAAKRNAYSLPLIVNSGSTEETTQYTATEDVSRIATAAMLENELPVGTQVGYLMPTPLGEVRGTAEVIRSDPQEVAGRLYYRTVLEFKEFEAQGRTTLQTLVNTTEGHGMRAVLRPDKKSVLPSMRIPIMVAFMIAIPLIVFQTYLFPIFNREDYTLRRFAELPKHDESGAMSAEQVEEFDKIHADMLSRSYPSNDRLVNEMTVLMSNYPEKPPAVDEKRRKMIDEVAIRLAPRAPNEVNLQMTLLYAYHHNQRYEDANKVFHDIEALRAQNRVTDDIWYVARLEGARVAVDASKGKEAEKLYDSLIKDNPGLLSLRNEYAGVLVRFGDIDKAEAVLKEINPDRVARKLIFDINLQRMAQFPQSEDARSKDPKERDRKRKAAFDEALKQITQMRFIPDQTEEDRLETDKMEANLYASVDRFEEAKKILDRIRLEQPADKAKDVIVKIAQMQLGMQKFEDALQTSELLLRDNDFSADTMRAFIDAASAWKTPDPMTNEKTTDAPLPVRETGFAKSVFERRAALQDDALYLTRLSWVLIRCDDKADSDTALNDAYAAFQKKPAAEQSNELRQEIAGLMIRHGNLPRAAQVLGGANTIAARKLGNDLLLQDKKFERALEDARDMERIFTSKDDKLDIQKRIANIYVAQGKFDEAMRAYENLKAQDKEAELKIAQLYLYKAIPPGKPGYDKDQYPKQLNQALQELEKVLEKPEAYSKASVMEADKNFIDAAAGVFACGVDSVSPKQAALAEKIADETLKSHGGDPKALSRLAWVLVKTNDKAKATKVLDKAVLLAPIDDETKKELSGVFAAAGQNKQAADLVKDLAKTDEEHLALAKLYSGGELWTEALREVEDVLKASPNNKEAQVLKADIISWSGRPGDHDKAIAEFELLINKYPDDLNLPVRLAEVMLWKKDYLKALEKFLALYDTQPNNEKVWYGIAATIAAIAGNTNGTVPKIAQNAIQSIAERLNTKGTKDVSLLARTALVMGYLKNKDLANKLINQAKALDTKDTIAKIELAAALAQLERFSEAVELYRSLPTLTSQNRIQLINLATSAEQLDLAAEQARLLVKEAENHKNDKALYKEYLTRKRILAQVLSWRGDYPESMALFQELLQVGFEKEDIKLWMAEVEVWAHQYAQGLIRFNDLIDTKLENAVVWIGFINSASSAPFMTNDQVKNILFINDKVASEIKTPELLSRLAWVLIRQGYAAKADPNLRRAVEMLKKDPKDASIRKEVAGVLVARLFPKQVIVPEPGQDLVTRRWLIREAIGLYNSLDPVIDFDQKTLIEFITLLLVSDEKANLVRAEELMQPLRSKTPKDSYELRIRFGEVLLYSAKYDPTGQKFKEAQQMFAQLLRDIGDPNNSWYQLAQVRLAEAYLWGKESDKALPLFKHALKNYVIPDRNQNIVRDVWLGYIDTLSAMIGDKFKVAKSEEDIDRIRQNLISAEDREYVMWAYQRADKFLPDPAMKLSDPEQYEKDVEYYTGSLSRLAIELAYMGDMTKSREVFNRAVGLNTDETNIRKLWTDYAEVLRHLRMNREADEIYQKLLPLSRAMR